MNAYIAGIIDGMEKAAKLQGTSWKGMPGAPVFKNEAVKAVTGKAADPDKTKVIKGLAEKAKKMVGSRKC